MSLGGVGWAVGFVIALVIISVSRNVFRRVGADVGREGLGRHQDDLERRLADVEEGQRRLGSGDTVDLERRVAELEERLDYAERALARKNDAERLAPPGH